MNDTVEHRDIKCDWLSDRSDCADGLAFNLSPDVNTKLLSCNTGQARIPSSVFLVFCNRGPAAPALVSFSIGFTPD